MKFENPKNESGLEAQLKDWEKFTQSEDQVTVNNGDTNVVFTLQTNGELLHHTEYGEINKATLDRWYKFAKQTLKATKESA